MDGPLAVTQPFGVGRGKQRPYAPANPAAGAALSDQTDGTGIRRFLSLVFTVTLANAGSDRAVVVEYRGGDGLPWASFSANATQTINTAQRYTCSFVQAVPAFAPSADTSFPIAPLLLHPGDLLVIAVQSMNAGDAITNVRGAFEWFPYDESWLPLPESG